MSIIDLGEVTSASAEPRPPGSDGRLTRQVALAVVAVLTVLAVAGSARPEPHGLHPLWSAPLAGGDTFYLTGDTAFVNRQNRGNRAVLSAYDLATGKPRWSADAGATVTYLDTVSAAGVLVLPGETAETAPVPDDSGTGTVTRLFTTSTFALDATTGAELWREPGEARSIEADTALMVQYDNRGRPNRLRLIRLRDGRTVWTKTIPGIETWAVAYRNGRPDVLVTASTRGEIAVSGYADGVPRRIGRVPWTPAKPESGTYTDLTVIGGFLVVNRTQMDHTASTVYRLDTLAELWSADDSFGGVQDCAGFLCVSDGFSTSARDLATGREVWRLRGLRSAWTVAPGRLLAGDGNGDGNGNGAYHLADAATGRILGRPATGDVTFSGPPDPDLLILKAVGPPLGRTSVTWLDPATGDQFLLGAVDRNEAEPCRTVRHYLACVNDARLIVTAVG